MKENIIDTYTSYFRKMVHNNACMILEKYNKNARICKKIYRFRN